MRTSALARTFVLAALALGLSAVSVGPAAADSTTPLPVVVPDTVRLYPGQVTQVNVLANDSSPTGASLDLCRFPEPDIDTIKPQQGVATLLPSFFYPKRGNVVVGIGRASTYVVDYFVCDTTHLVPARLTLERLPVSPVTVRKVPGKPGKLSVHNTNDVAVTFVAGHPGSMRRDVEVRVAAGATRTVTVQRRTVAWRAEIGTSRGEWGSPGCADQGRVRHIELDGRPLPKPKDLPAPAPEAVASADKHKGR